MRLDADFDDILIIALEYVVEYFQELNFINLPAKRFGVVTRIGNGSGEEVQAWRGNLHTACFCSAFRLVIQLGTNTTSRTTEHIPNNQAVHTLFAVNYLGNQPCMYARPCVMARIGARILAERPDDELIRICRTLKNIGIVFIETTLCFDNTDAIVNTNFIVVSLA